MRLSPIRACARTLNSPLLINEYILSQGNVWSQFEMDHTMDLMEIWRVCRKPVKLHPLRWLNSLKAREVVSILETQFPIGSETVEGIPIEAFVGTDKEEVYAHSDEFVKDDLYDEGMWLEDFKSLEVNPFIAHQYILRICPKHKHTLVPCDPEKTLTYRGYSMRATRERFRGDIPLYDVASLGGMRFRGESDNEIVAAIRKYRKNKRGMSVMVSDMHNYGSKTLKKFLDPGDFPVLTGSDVYLMLGLSTYKSPNSKLDFEPEFIQELFDGMKPIRESFVMTRMGQNPYILLTREMCKFMVDELIQDGLLMT